MILEDLEQILALLVRIGTSRVKLQTARPVQ